MWRSAMMFAMVAMPASALAQQNSVPGLVNPPHDQPMTAADQTTRRAVEATVSRWTAAINRGDMPTLRNLFTPDAIFVDPYGLATTPASIQQAAAAIHKASMSLSVTVKDVRPLPGRQMILCTASFIGSYGNAPAAAQVHGIDLFVLQQSGTDWKILALSVSRGAAAPLSK